LTLTSAPLSLNRSNQARVISVTGQVVGRDLGSVMQEVQREIEAMNIPASIQVDYTGQVELMAEAFEQLGLALILAVFLVYAIMASPSSPLRHPLAVMFAMPSALIGVLFGLRVTGHTTNVPSLIGIILLAAIVVNNAIVRVDYVNLLRREGMAREEALIEAGRTRLRPILMTALTTILGMLPLALGIGEGAEIQAPLAVAVVFGLTFATFLTLFIIPLAYQWTDDLGRRFSRRKPQRELPGPCLVATRLLERSRERDASLAWDGSLVRWSSRRGDPLDPAGGPPGPGPGRPAGGRPGGRPQPGFRRESRRWGRRLAGADPGGGRRPGPGAERPDPPGGGRPGRGPAGLGGDPGPAPDAAQPRHSPAGRDGV